MPSQLDPGQIIKRAYDETNNRVRVDAELSIESSGEQEVIISHVDDSIKIGDGSSLVNTTQVGADIGLNVNLIGGVVSGEFQSTGLSTALKQQVITVTDVAAKVPATALTNRNGISVRVWGVNTVYFGSSNVTVNNGYPKRQYEEIVIDIKDDSAVELYAVCESGQTCELRIIELA